jgi:hypothetical protein
MRRLDQCWQYSRRRSYDLCRPYPTTRNEKTPISISNRDSALFWDAYLQKNKALAAIRGSGLKSLLATAVWKKIALKQLTNSSR